ncbi:hypothetical protein M885DRAFT_532312 [Pelagophyceae sp. CCMP2097]|nr:hypothetical protein M885DRAFT_532312 [Pelagophyceae sp. CCMP2097]
MACPVCLCSGSPSLCGDCVEQGLSTARMQLKATADGLVPCLRRRNALEFQLSSEAWRLRPPRHDDAQVRQCKAQLHRVGQRVGTDRIELAKAKAHLALRLSTLAKASQDISSRRRELELLRCAMRGPAVPPPTSPNANAHAAASLRADDAMPPVLQRSPWSRALDLFDLFPIEAKTPPRRGSLRGVMTIVGLPLPNSASGGGPALPAAVSRAALAAVVQLAAGVAAALRIELPHPLVPRSAQADTAAVDDRAKAPRQRYTLSPTPQRKAPPGQTRSTDDDSPFSTALHLLQNDVVHLCVKAGAAPDALWPAEALLLNLATLRDCARERRGDACPPSPPPSPPRAPAQKSTPQSTPPPPPYEPLATPRREPERRRTSPPPAPASPLHGGASVTSGASSSSDHGSHCESESNWELVDAAGALPFLINEPRAH